jgi:hypothetical protein
MSEKRKLINIRLNGKPTTWKAMDGLHGLQYKAIYNKAVKSNKTVMTINGDLIKWDLAKTETYFIIEGKRMETIHDVARYLKISYHTVSKLLERSGTSFSYNRMLVKRITKIKDTEGSEGIIDASTKLVERKLFEYDTIECGSQTLVRKFYIGLQRRTLMHTYGYEQGKQFLAV